MNQLMAALGFGLVSSAIVAIGGVGFTLQFGVSGIFNVAYGAVMTTAAFVAYFANSILGLNIWVGVIFAAATGAVLSVVIERGVYAPFIRRGSSIFSVIMVSFGIAIAVQSTIQAIAGLSPLTFNLGQQSSVRLGAMSWTNNEIIIMALAIVSMVVLHAILRSTKLGKAMRAVADEPELGRACGIDTGRVTTIAWALSGALCGIAGGVLALETVTFANDIGANYLFVIIAAAVVGGVGQPYGAMLGALVIGVSSQIAGIVAPVFVEVVPLALLVLVLLVRPDGLRSGGALRKETATA
ncbi:branched-chain amino acid ABC transporter permease [Acidothermaceae bacterium B102]|nr:branched-chain amino acid ABC transporter permease [Acidothermaceae bacterium B102]